MAKKQYKNDYWKIKPMLENLINKYDNLGNQTQAQLVSMAEELGYWKSLNFPERKKLALKLDLYVEMYNDLIEIMETIEGDEE